MKPIVTSFICGGSERRTVTTPALPEVGRPCGWDYIHGTAEDKMCDRGGYDIPCFFGSCPTEPGIHEVIIDYGDHQVNGTYFLWRVNGSGSMAGRMRGLIVETDHLEDWQYALQNYEVQSPHL